MIVHGIIQRRHCGINCGIFYSVAVKIAVRISRCQRETETVTPYILQRGSVDTPPLQAEVSKNGTDGVEARMRGRYPPAPRGVGVWLKVRFQDQRQE